MQKKLASIKTWYSKIGNIGVYSDTEFNIKKKIHLLNIYTLIWAHLSIIYLISDYISGHFKLTLAILHCTGFITMLFIFGLHKHKKYNTAKNIWMLHAHINFFLLITVLSKASFFEYFFLLLPCFALSLYKEINISRIILLISITLFLSPYHIFNIYPKEYVETLQIPVVLGIFGSLFMLVLYFRKTNFKNEEELNEDKKLLINQQEELKALNEFKSHFFVNLSHEIRTPIALIKGYTSKIDFKKSEAYNKQQIKVVNNQLDQIHNIVNTIMDLGKMDHNKLTLSIKETSLHQFLNKRYADFKALFDKKNINFSILLPEKDLLIKVDEYQMERCISNLLNNALKFTNIGGKVTLYANHSNTLEIGIWDNGIGIPENDMDKIFERFYQSKNHITKSQGSGIGLSFTKNIIEEHGFSITAESVPNHKTTFKINIPKIYLLKPVELDKKSVTSIFKGKILIVDDHEQMRIYIKSLFSNFNIIEAENGLQAQHIVKTEKIDLIITDYMMPVMNGYEFVTNIKNTGYKIPVIVITARGDDEGKLNMMRLGIDSYLTKPFLEEELLYVANNSLKLYKNIISSEEKATMEELKESNEAAQVFYNSLINIIKEKYSFNDFGVDDLAHALDTSKRTLNRKTKLLLGQTPNQLIIEVRLQKALEIKNEQPNISKRELAKLVGLTNASYLSKRLKIRFGKHKEQLSV